PGGATEIMVFKLWKDGFIGLNLGSSAAQSVILMAVVIALTMLQFRFAEKKVTY
ncbi:MAG TPA: glycerol-3-phosphate transporter permease, partial [Methylomirabilota bacterium]